jgi:hypothetical protein
MIGAAGLDHLGGERKWVQRICRAAGVPKVSAHGMRGLHTWENDFNRSQNRLFNRD